MGFWGCLTVMRGDDQPTGRWNGPPELVARFAAQDPPVPLGPGWYLLRSGGEPGDLDTEAAAMAAATAAPALIAFVLDSDCAVVHAATPRGLRWSAVLNPDLAEDYGAPPATPVDAAVAGAVAWASEAGLVADPGVLRAAMTDSDTFVEDLFDRLLRGLGLSPGA